MMARYRVRILQAMLVVMITIIAIESQLGRSRSPTQGQKPLGASVFYLLKEELDGPGIITMTDYEESITYVRRTNMESITQERVKRKLIEQLDSTLSGLFGGVEKPAATQYIVEFQHRRWRITVNTSNEKSSGGNSFEGKFYLVQERMED